ncbi:tRNA lysidine(34) synthetase TilS [Dermabacteraceae bacterium TAE3-ERU27]|nr:tRNA lysidine(34) synthetase TilS [Dermabacteraceae bacterium TAE3-ERU27]
MAPEASLRRAQLAVRAALVGLIAEGADASDPAAQPRVLVGVSGGADSLALAAVCADVCPALGIACEAAIIDHAMQADSAEVAERAAAACHEIGMTAVHVRRVLVSGASEDAARQSRHAELAKLCRERAALAVLLAHTADDQAEQVLLSLARGSGAAALAGVPRRREHLLRPFLGTGRDEVTAIGRKETEEICRLRGIAFWRDPMNRDTRYLRSRVRHEVMPLLREKLGEQVPVNLRRSADLLRDDSDLLESLALTLAEEAALTPEDGELLAFSLPRLTAAPRPLTRRVLRDAARRAAQLGESPSGKTLGRSHVLMMDALVHEWRGQGPVPLPGRIEACRSNGRIRFVQPPS